MVAERCRARSMRSRWTKPSGVRLSAARTRRSRVRRLVPSDCATEGDVERFVQAGAHEAFELDDDRVLVPEMFVGDEGRLRRTLVDDEELGDMLGQVGADRSHE